jgi:hypothetical protein
MGGYFIDHHHACQRAADRLIVEIDEGKTARVFVFARRSAEVDHHVPRHGVVLEAE